MKILVFILMAAGTMAGQQATYAYRYPCEVTQRRVLIGGDTWTCVDDDKTIDLVNRIAALEKRVDALYAVANLSVQAQESLKNEAEQLLKVNEALEKRVKELETRTIRYLPEGVVCDGEGSNATCHDEYRKARGKK